MHFQSVFSLGGFYRILITNAAFELAYNRAEVYLNLQNVIALPGFYFLLRPNCGRIGALPPSPLSGKSRSAVGCPSVRSISTSILLLLFCRDDTGISAVEMPPFLSLKVDIS